MSSADMNDVLAVAPGGKLGGTIEVPGDKSISHRAVMFGAIARGETRIDGCLLGEDVKATIGAFRAMGVSIEIKDGVVQVVGNGYAALRKPIAPLDLGNSGTSMRLLAGLLAACPFDIEMHGDESLSRRPMRRVTDPLAQMGATIESTGDGTPPLTIRGGATLKGIHYALPVASAQVKSAVLLAGLHARGETCVVESTPTRDHSERMLASFGVALRRSAGTICHDGSATLTATDVRVPGDISSAAFFLVGAAMRPGAEMLVRKVGINPTRTGVIDILKLMGADIHLKEIVDDVAEPYANIAVRGSRLNGIDIPQHLIANAIDEFPAIFVAAASANGTTRLRGAAELRHKESDRIAMMAQGLQALGVDLTVFDDGIEIRGCAEPFKGARIDSVGDHRIAMSFAIAALNASAPIEIANSAAIATSFPSFVSLAQQAGLRVM